MEAGWGNPPGCKMENELTIEDLKSLLVVSDTSLQVMEGCTLRSVLRALGQHDAADALQRIIDEVKNDED